MVYLAELLVVMTDRLKLSEFMLEMCPVNRHKRLDDDAFLASLSLAPGKRRHRVLMCRGAVLLKHKKPSPDNLRMSGSGL